VLQEEKPRTGRYRGHVRAIADRLGPPAAVAHEARRELHALA
jgi:hypothetical protein